MILCCNFAMTLAYEDWLEKRDRNWGEQQKSPMLDYYTCTFVLLFWMLLCCSPACVAGAPSLFLRWKSFLNIPTLPLSPPQVLQRVPNTCPWGSALFCYFPGPSPKREAHSNFEPDCLGNHVWNPPHNKKTGNVTSTHIPSNNITYSLSKGYYISAAGARSELAWEYTYNSSNRWHINMLQPLLCTSYFYHFPSLRLFCRVPACGSKRRLLRAWNKKYTSGTKNPPHPSTHTASGSCDTLHLSPNARCAMDLNPPEFSFCHHLLSLSRPTFPTTVIRRYPSGFP